MTGKWSSFQQNELCPGMIEHPCGKSKLWPSSQITNKSEWKWIVVKAKTVKLLEEITGESIRDLGLDKDLLTCINKKYKPKRK